VALWSLVFHVSVSDSKLIMFYVSLVWDVPFQRVMCPEANSKILLLCKRENYTIQL